MSSIRLSAPATLPACLPPSFCRHPGPLLRSEEHAGLAGSQRKSRYPTPPPFNRGRGPDRLAGSAGALPSLVDAPLRVPARPWLPASLGMNRALQTMAGESTSKTESRTSP